jgi:hypothetical protein
MGRLTRRPRFIVRDHNEQAAGAYSVVTQNDGGDDSGDDGRRSPLLPTSHRQQHHDRFSLLLMPV